MMTNNRVPSVLGTKSHWDQAYVREMRNFTTHPTEENLVCWFEESDAENRIITYLSSQNLSSISKFLDIGTGNGHLLFELLDSGEYDKSIFVGIDYSIPAIELAQKIALNRGAQDIIKFHAADIMKEDILVADWLPEGGFDVVLDKGTYDAISLSDERLEVGRRLYEDYPQKVAAVMKEGGFVVITSCNWTGEELKRNFRTVQELEYYGRIQYPTFLFGGQAGQTISTICFKKVQV